MGLYTSKEMRRFNHLMGETDAVYHDIALKLGLSDSSMMILYTICDVGDCCPLQEICRRSCLSKQTINSALRKMEADGLLYLELSGKKSKTVHLTEKGTQLANTTAVRLIEMENEIFHSWNKEDLEKYLNLTELFLVELQKKAKELEK